MELRHTGMAIYRERGQVGLAPVHLSIRKAIRSHVIALKLIGQ
jgi:hypothetical protein